MANEIQINLSAPGLEAAIKALTDAIISAGTNGMKEVIPVNTASQIAGAQPTAPQVQTNSVPAKQSTAPAQVMQTGTHVAPSNAQPQAAQQQQTAQFMNNPASTPAQTGVTLDAIVTAGAGLVEKGLMNQVIALLGKYGVQAVNQIQPPQYDAFAAELRTLGAQI